VSHDPHSPNPGSTVGTNPRTPNKLNYQNLSRAALRVLLEGHRGAHSCSRVKDHFRFATQDNDSAANSLLRSAGDFKTSHKITTYRHKTLPQFPLNFTTSHKITTLRHKTLPHFPLSSLPCVTRHAPTSPAHLHGVGYTRLQELDPHVWGAKIADNAFAVGVAGGQHLRHRRSTLEKIRTVPLVLTAHKEHVQPLW
jgi:hypothetical protein